MNLNIIKNEGSDYISAIELQKELNSTENFSNWIKRLVKRAYLVEVKDFLRSIKQSTGGRNATDYQFTIQAAKEMCIVSATSKAKELRRWLISLDEKRSNLELMTVKEAVFAIKVINCLKYITNQKESYSLHQKSFIKENSDSIDSKFIFADFAKYRAKIVGWNKEQTDKAIIEYLDKHTGYPRSKIMKSTMSDKLSVMDIGEAIRVAVLDICYTNHEDPNMANNFSNLCKNLAKEMEIKPEIENKPNLFHDKSIIDDVKDIKILK